MPTKPKPIQSAPMKVIKPKPQANRGGGLMTPYEMKKKQLKRNKKPSKDSTGYRNAGSA